MLIEPRNIPFFPSSPTISQGSESHSLTLGTLGVDLEEGDSFSACDKEGDQFCLVLIWDKQKNRFAPEVLQKKSQEKQLKIAELLNFKSGIKVQKWLDANKIMPPDLLECASIFGNLSAAGEKIDLTADAQLSCLFVMPDEDMTPDSQNARSEIQISVQRKVAKDSKLAHPLPTPLAEPVQEIRIENSTARSYRVMEGEYIQIVDVQGHQCSDFQAFAASDLERKEMLAIDPTVTRSIMGSIYPSPGVHSKYYNIDSVPLIEVVRDTVGRHDTFGLACNSKYYEDRGHFGHPNCSDNFNQTLKDHGVSERRNWVTVNLYFNTSVLECHSIAADVSWSRAGDYVLFRAMTDIVCVTSACPDDTTPANNWNPTDIHVRVYGKENNFKRATALRTTPLSIPKMTKETGFHPRTSQLTRNFEDYKGFWLPNNFNQYGAIKEYWACREGVIAIDLSALRKFEVYGQDAEALMQYALTRNIRKLAVDQVVYTSICYENGGMIDDGTLFRLCNNNFRWICGDEFCGEWLRRLAVEKNMEVWIRSSTDQLHNISIQGPKSRDLLKKIVWTSPHRSTLEELGWFRLTTGRLHDERGTPIMVSRTGYTGELGYEIFCHPKNAVEVWDEVFKAGAEFDITPLGLEALDMLRIEAGLVFAGYEFCDQTNPFEAGVGFTVPLKSKEDDFCGKAALIERKAHPAQQLVGLELEEKEVPNHGDGVFIERQQVGVITSATRSPILRKNIALCKISAKHAELETIVEVGKLDGHQKRIKAKIVPFPFYDPQKTRVRM